MKKDLLKLANNLDAAGYFKEADLVDGLMKKLSQSTPIEYDFTSGGEDDEAMRKKLYETSGRSTFTQADLATNYGFENFSRQQMVQIQDGLNSAGFNAGKADGVWGPRTNDAFLDAVHAFALLISESESPELKNKDLELLGGRFSATVLNLAEGKNASMPFRFVDVMDMLRRLRDERARGGYISAGRPIKDFPGSKGVGEYVPSTEDESELVSTSSFRRKQK